MPYHIIKSGKGFKVENKETKQKYSKKPMTKTNAEKQKKLLTIIESKKKK
tara:strand:+ start:7084 stop:7233 length:150 start_codon:yes stop_codon:yes gene_type:complete